MVIFGFPFTPDLVGSIPIVTVIFALCPWALLSKAFNDLGNAAADGQPGLSWSNRARCEYAPEEPKPWCSVT